MFDDYVLKFALSSLISLPYLLLIIIKFDHLAYIVEYFIFE